MQLHVHVLVMYSLHVYTSKGTLDNEKLCGRPLGLHFHPKIPDELYVADSSIGIIKVNVKSRQVTTVVLKNSILGDRGILNFPNDLVVLANETVLFTDSSRKYSRHQNRLEFFESRAHGELLYYNPSDETYGVLKEGMFFPNGICLTQDGNALLIAETTRARILRYCKFSGGERFVVQILPCIIPSLHPILGGGGGGYIIIPESFACVYAL